MVAIIGGFLVSRLVALSSEREGIARQLKAAEQRLVLHRAEYEPAHEYRLGNSIETMEEWLLDKLIDERLESEGKGTAELVDVPRGSSLEEMLPYAEELRKRVDISFADVTDLITERDHRRLSFDSLVERGLTFAEEDRDLFIRVASSVIGGLRPSARYDFGNIGTDTLRFVTSPTSHEIEMRRLDESIRSESDLHALVVAGEHEVERLGRDLDDFAQPVGVTSAVWILAAFSIAGIMAPLLVMAFWSKPIPVWLLFVLVVGFGAGLAAVLGYIAWYQREISGRSVPDESDYDDVAPSDATSTDGFSGDQTA
ncbi:hypothetical protein SAMN05428985_104462 [Nocardioides sp. YR527]|nr:hypothetical protein SAMN05428985_104462 [Nocardioides sp. YR527]